MPIQFGLPQNLPNETERRRLYVREGRLLATIQRDRAVFPDRTETAALEPLIERELYVGEQDGIKWTVCRVSSDAPDRFVHLRALLPVMTRAQFDLAGRALHLLHWDTTTQFCGCCGTKNDWAPDSESKECPVCGYLSFPRVAPAIIVAVTRSDEILLARAKKFTAPIYSVLAGFAEPGETLEDCVRREVCEEVGVNVTNIRYFDSQPWPFPNSLMIGYFADYESGEIRLNDGEILEADWYRANSLPPGPIRLSIAKRLIEAFIQQATETRQ